MKLAKKILKILIVLSCIIALVTGILTFISTGDFTNLPPIVFLFFVTIFLMIKFSKHNSDEDYLENEDFILEEELQKNNFKISKDIDTGYQRFLVDDLSKRFAILDYDYISFFSFSDLRTFELNEDGQSLVQGKNFSTIFTNSINRNSNSFRNESHCSSLIIRLIVSNSQDSEIILPFISSQIKKTSFIYTSNLNLANDVVETLNYIENSRI